ncbi:MAG: glycine oxidase ThiO [Isosphaeraceae bacterium]
MNRDVVIVGGGVIGLSIAYVLAREGLGVTVLDRGRLGGEASGAGAGLIPPTGDEGRRPSRVPIAALRSWSASLFSDWSAALREETGVDNGYRRCGGVDVAWTEIEAQALRADAGRWRAEGIACERLAPADYPRVEPALNRDLPLAYFLPDRAQIRNPRHLRALAAAATSRGATLLPDHEVQRLDRRGDRVAAVQTRQGEFPCKWVVVASGAWSGRLLEHVGVRAPTPPVKGQIVLLRDDRPLLRRIVEHGKDYLVPRDDGRILVGATEEDAGFDTRPTEASYRMLLDRAIRLCPVLADARVEATWAGLRPGSIDGKPYIGPAPGFRNLVLATGHQRAGLQLSPATAELVADLVLGRPLRIDPSPFRPDRDPQPVDDAFRS